MVSIQPQARSVLKKTLAVIDIKEEFSVPEVLAFQILSMSKIDADNMVFQDVFVFIPNAKDNRDSDGTCSVLFLWSDKG